MEKLVEQLAEMDKEQRDEITIDRKDLLDGITMLLSQYKLLFKLHGDTNSIQAISDLQAHVTQWGTDFVKDHVEHNPKHDNLS